MQIVGILLVAALMVLPVASGAASGAVVPGDGRDAVGDRRCGRRSWASSPRGSPGSRPAARSSWSRRSPTSPRGGRGTDAADRPRGAADGEARRWRTASRPAGEVHATVERPAREAVGQRTRRSAAPSSRRWPRRPARRRSPTSRRGRPALPRSRGLPQPRGARAGPRRAPRRAPGRVRALRAGRGPHRAPPPPGLFLVRAVEDVRAPPRSRPRWTGRSTTWPGAQGSPPWSTGSTWSASAATARRGPAR